MGAKLSKDPDTAYMRDCSVMPPAPLLWLGQLLVRGCYALMDNMLPPPMRAADLAITSYTVAEVMRTLCALGIPDALAMGPQTAAEVATAIGGADDERVFRLLRFAAVHNLIGAERASWRALPQSAHSVRFRNNRLSACLREDHPNSQKFAVLAVISRQHLGAGWQELEWGVRNTGGRMFERYYGAPFFQHLTDVPGLEQTYSKGMAALDHSCAASIITDYRWRAHARFIDIGGAYGSFLAELLRTNPGTTGVLFDQPQVIKRAQKEWEASPDKAALLPRVAFVSGDFFKPDTLPAAKGNNTVYIMRQILHDWPDVAALSILGSVRQAMGSTASTLALVEAVILPAASPTADVMNRARAASDLHMMVQHDGKERDVDQWRSILADAGFRLHRVVRTRSIFSVVEAVLL